jgi:hypothetical protein
MTPQSFFMRGPLAALLPAAIVAGVLITLPHPASAGTLVVNAVPAGYTTGSIELGLDYAGALAQDPADANRLYAAVGSFGAQSILSVNIAAGTTQTVATGFGSIGGLAVLANGDLAITENFTSDTIFRARDTDLDGKFLSAGEVSMLIAPILDDGNFSGTQAAVAPAGNASAIPQGALLVQTADGGTSGELLVIQDPVTSPVYRPAGGAYASGFNYNGGFAFDQQGNVILGSAGFLSGEILALVNTNANDRIDAGESNVIVGAATLGLGESDLAVSEENRVFFGENSGTVRTFDLPANLLTGTAAPVAFAQTNATYMSTVRMDFPDRTFASGASETVARLYLSGYLAGFAVASNIAYIQPTPVASVPDWTVY